MSTNFARRFKRMKRQFMELEVVVGEIRTMLRGRGLEVTTVSQLPALLKALLEEADRAPRPGQVHGGPAPAPTALIPLEDLIDDSIDPSDPWQLTEDIREEDLGLDSAAPDLDAFAALARKRNEEAIQRAEAGGVAASSGSGSGEPVNQHTGMTRSQQAKVIAKITGKPIEDRVGGNMNTGTR